ncbi:MAG: hypothetical protein ACREA4_05830, partial [Nitrososphaera sp.]
MPELNKELAHWKYFYNCVSPRFDLVHLAPKHRCNFFKIMALSISITPLFVLYIVNKYLKVKMI